MAKGINWRTVLEANPYLWNFKYWGWVDVAQIKDTKLRRIAQRNISIVVEVLNRKKLKDIAKRFSVSPQLITYIMNRCLVSVAHDEDPPLCEALNPYHHLKKAERLSALDPAYLGGDKCALTHTLKNYPDIVEIIDAELLGYIKRRKEAENHTPASLHRKFLRLLDERNHSTQGYPSNRARQGYVSFVAYVKRRTEELRLPTPINRRDYDRDISLPRIYEQVEIDEHTLDIFVSVDVELDGFVMSHRIKRPIIIYACDLCSGAALGYELILSKAATQEDVIRLLRKIRKPWKQRKLTAPRLKYPLGACFPTILDEQFENISIGTLRMDNALCHHANRVRQFICDQMNSILNLGHPGDARSRHSVEFDFKPLSKMMKRFSSTAGSNVLDPLKETTKNSKTAPLLKLDWLEDILEVFFSTHNIKPLARNFAKSPAEILRSQVIQLPVTMDFSRLYKNVNADMLSDTVKVLRNVKENRRPHINYVYLKYQGDAICDAKLVGKEIRIEYDIDDMRVIKAYKKSGKYLGELRPPVSRRGFPLSLKTLRYIENRARKTGDMSIKTADDLIRHLSQKKLTAANLSNIVRLYRELRDPEISNCNEFNSKTPITNATSKSPKVKSYQDVLKEICEKNEKQ